ncbi:glycosyltransferase family 9 protein [Xanthomonas sp. WHRI 8932A]|uniref:glycosyltransferase family 9 protein n=1 Tax=unclassified Xanthomonas TaxID=2643310 RepID=UPI002B23C969|nr:glycosyltransferase family 9 protein [Xanthomonas sp. WHRI 8932A]MEA9566355.1 glycosyltransferase family 9 protein [Xanthomonas sp. WHRI 8932A]
MNDRAAAGPPLARESSDAIVFPMEGAHTGDLLMALPAIGAALQQSPVAVVGLRPTYYRALRRLPIQFRFHVDGGRVLKPHWRANVHPTNVWLQSLSEDAKPVRMDIPTDDGPWISHLMPGGPWVMLSPWADFAPKRWAPERWRALAGYIADSGFSVAVSGPPQSQALADYIAGDSHANLVGMDTPENWPALLRRPGLVVTVDSGQLYFCDAMRVPVIGLHGRTRLSEAGPYWDNSLCVEANGMDAVSLDAVVASFERWAAGMNGSSPLPQRLQG